MQPTLALISPGTRSADKAGAGRLEKAGARANCASIRPSTYPQAAVVEVQITQHQLNASVVPRILIIMLWFVARVASSKPTAAGANLPLVACERGARAVCPRQKGHNSSTAVVFKLEKWRRRARSHYRRRRTRRQQVPGTHQLTAVCVMCAEKERKTQVLRRVSPPAQKLHRRVRVETVNLIFSSKPTAAKHCSGNCAWSLLHLLSRSFALSQILLFFTTPCLELKEKTTYMNSGCVESGMKFAKTM